MGIYVKYLTDKVLNYKDEITKALNNNTKVIEKLCLKLDIDIRKEDEKNEID